MKIDFQTNMPFECCLMTLDGETAESKFGGPQRKFTTTERDIFYVSESVGNIIADTCRKLRIEEREPVVICKAEVPDGRGRKQIRWQVTRVNAPPPRDGPQADGGFAVPFDAQGVPPGGVGKTTINTNGANGVHPPAPHIAPTTPVQQPMPVSNGNGNALPPVNGHAAAAPESSGWAGYLQAQAQTLVDVYAGVLVYSGKYGAAVKPDDVRSIVLSCFINLTKGGNNGNGHSGGPR